MPLSSIFWRYDRPKMYWVCVIPVHSKHFTAMYWATSGWYEIWPHDLASVWRWLLVTGTACMLIVSSRSLVGIPLVCHDTYASRSNHWGRLSLFFELSSHTFSSGSSIQVVLCQDLFDVSYSSSCLPIIYFGLYEIRSKRVGGGYMVGEGDCGANTISIDI